MDDLDSVFISGIHNWCDRWCERCAFTARCRVFERERKRELKDPEDFWNDLAENFKETVELLHAMAEAHGIDLAQIVKETEGDTSLEEEDKILDEHPLCMLTEQYLFEGKDWLESSRIKDYFEEFTRQVDLGLVEYSVAKVQVAKFEDALEVIRWYLFFIPVKSKRVLNDLSADFGEDCSESEKTYNGSAKIAMISIERSMQAWKILLDALPAEEGSILALLVLLEKSRKSLSSLVPNYARFIRPGFDE